MQGSSLPDLVTRVNEPVRSPIVETDTFLPFICNIVASGSLVRYAFFSKIGHSKQIIFDFKIQILSLKGLNKKN